MEVGSLMLEVEKLKFDDGCCKLEVGEPNGRKTNQTRPCRVPRFNKRNTCFIVWFPLKVDCD